MLVLFMLCLFIQNLFTLLQPIMADPYMLMIYLITYGVAMVILMACIGIRFHVGHIINGIISGVFTILGIVLTNIFQVGTRIVPWYVHQVARSYLLTYRGLKTKGVHQVICFLVGCLAALVVIVL